MHGVKEQVHCREADWLSLIAPGRLSLGAPRVPHVANSSSSQFWVAEKTWLMGRKKFICSSDRQSLLCSILTDNLVVMLLTTLLVPPVSADIMFHTGGA